MVCLRFAKIGFHREFSHKALYAFPPLLTEGVLSKKVECSSDVLLNKRNTYSTTSKKVSGGNYGNYPFSENDNGDNHLFKSLTKEKVPPEAPDVQEDELMTALLMSRLSNLVYLPDPAIELQADGFRLIAAGKTPFTSFFVADRASPVNSCSASVSDAVTDNVTWTRFVITRGVAWSNPSVDSRQMWIKLSTFWPVKFEKDFIAPSIDLVAHAGVYDIAKEVFQKIGHYLTFDSELGKISSVQFGGHSLGGSLALLLMLMARSRLDTFNGCRDLTYYVNMKVHTFGSPPVLACDREDKALNYEASKFNGSSSYSMGMKTHQITENGCLVMKGLGLELGTVKAYVLDKDIIPRAFLTSDPTYSLVSNWGFMQSAMDWREQLWGKGIIFTRNRFLYQNVGVVYFMQSQENGVVIQRLFPNQADEVLRIDSPNVLSQPSTLIKMMTDHYRENYTSNLEVALRDSAVIT